ncbi:Gfo/Idh/MocA family protein [Aquibacillus salsiterrae]|uniref:Gfo/Idh/MocA family oxidoreductase n=1 Tax=Aquibacillus salsiterrae TaxID=2950439 RepID=A0A9X3WET6_9BACI|nr:Gfo/Idh/MocA family oxidoreductase [Aquibacillus salsiterrae]MDC3416104.1 Gfo/Idh/MocA family oxidoreductase [Aquibacillus salsiterrae]
MTKLKWGVLSTAKIGREQVIPAIQRSNNGEVVAIASRGDYVLEVAKAFGIPKTYTTYQSLLEDDTIEAVYIPLPNSLHKEWVIKAAEHGKHILCEKPIGLNAAELEEMVAACQQHGVTLMEAFMYQFHPQHDKVKTLIADGEIGDVRFIRSSFSFVLNGDNNIRLNPELGGGSLYDVGCYTLHIGRYILDAEPTTVYTSAKIHPEFNVEVSAAGVLTFAGGVHVLFDSSFESTFRQSYQVVGSNGTIDVDGAFRPDTMDGGAGKIILKKDNGDVQQFEVEADQYKLQVEHFVDSIRANQEPSYSVEKMRGQMKVLDACLASIKTGTAIPLK